MDYSNQTLPPVEIPNRDSIFVWIDILGFSKDLEVRNNYGMLKNTLSEFRNIFKMTFAHQAVISDGILLEIPYENHQWNPTKITDIFKEIADNQLSFILKHKKVVRGGIATGNPISKDDYDNRIYVSDGLARAYRIESIDSSWPIIGITQDEVSKLIDYSKSRNEDFGLKITYNASGKKIYFLNFVDSLLASSRTEDSVSELKQLIEEKLEQNNSTDDRTRSKYFWILKYLKSTLGTNIPEKYKEHIL